MDNYTSSYLAISACFFNPQENKAQHVLLNLYTVSHPHTGEMIADLFQMCLAYWEIDPRKILYIITDNGSNMIKAVRILKERDVQSLNVGACDSDSDDSDVINGGSMN